MLFLKQYWSKLAFYLFLFSSSAISCLCCLLASKLKPRSVGGRGWWMRNREKIRQNIHYLLPHMTQSGSSLIFPECHGMILTPQAAKLWKYLCRDGLRGHTEVWFLWQTWSDLRVGGCWKGDLAYHPICLKNFICLFFFFKDLQKKIHHTYLFLKHR